MNKEKTQDAKVKAANLDAGLVVDNGHGFRHGNLLDTLALLLGAVASLGPLACGITGEHNELGLVKLQALNVLQNEQLEQLG